MSKIGDFVKKWRKEQGLDRKQAAEHLYCNAETLRRWELGLSDPTYTMVRVIHDQTGAEWEDLF